MRKNSLERKKQNNTLQTNIFNVTNQYIQQGQGNVQKIKNLPDKREEENYAKKKWVKTLERILGGAAAIATIISLVFVIAGKERTITSISINSTALEMKVGEATQLIVKAICSDNSEVDDVFWSTSNPLVVDVDQNGRLVAIEAGEAVISAQATVDKDVKNVSCSVKVSAPPSGYSISVGASSVCLFESFNVVVVPYGKDITEIWVCAKAPSGKVEKRLLDNYGKGRYLIDTERGVWEIYAIVKNASGEYVASKPEDVVYLEVK